MAPPETNAALFGRCGDRPGLAATRDRVEENVGLKEAFGDGCGAVV